MLEDNTDSSDLRFDVGRADGGRTFVRVVHIPTGKSRTIVGLGNRTAEDVAAELAKDLMRELAEGMGFEPT
jgi:hypothetical protein